MAPPVEAPLNPEAVARAVTGLPAALFIGDVSGPLNAETSALGEKLDPKLEEIKVKKASIHIADPQRVTMYIRFLDTHSNRIQ